MSLPELEQYRIQKLLDAFCDHRVPLALRDEVRLDYEIAGDRVTLFELRPRFDLPGEWSKAKVAQFEYNPETVGWSLYCFDRNARRRRYRDWPEERAFERFLFEVDLDPTGVFWG